MTGACHAPVNGRQGKALADTDPNASPVSIEKSADLKMDGREDFQNLLCLWAAALKQIRFAKRLSVTPYFEDVGTTCKPRKTAEASAEAACLLGEPTVLCSRRMKVS